jgi:hypothetical protein
MIYCRASSAHVFPVGFMSCQAERASLAILVALDFPRKKLHERRVFSSRCPTQKLFTSLATSLVFFRSQARNCFFLLASKICMYVHVTVSSSWSLKFGVCHLTIRTVSPIRPPSELFLHVGPLRKYFSQSAT